MKRLLLYINHRAALPVTIQAIKEGLCLRVFESV